MEKTKVYALLYTENSDDRCGSEVEVFTDEQAARAEMQRQYAQTLNNLYPFPFPVIHTDYFRTPTRSQSDDGPRRYRHSAGAQQERKREKKKGRNGAPRRNRLTKAQPGTYPTTKRRRKRAYDTKMRRMWERI